MSNNSHHHSLSSHLFWRLFPMFVWVGWFFINDFHTFVSGLIFADFLSFQFWLPHSKVCSRETTTNLEKFYSPWTSGGHTAMLILMWTLKFYGQHFSADLIYVSSSAISLSIKVGANIEIEFRSLLKQEKCHLRVSLLLLSPPPHWRWVKTRKICISHPYTGLKCLIFEQFICLLLSRMLSPFLRNYYCNKIWYIVHW